MGDYSETTREKLVMKWTDWDTQDEMDNIQDEMDNIQDDMDEEACARWEIIFSILFPREAQPSSPFVDRECNDTVLAASSCTTKLTLDDSIGWLIKACKVLAIRCSL